MFQVAKSNLSSFTIFSLFAKTSVFLQLSCQVSFSISYAKFNMRMNLTDTAEDSKLVHRRKRPKLDALFSSLFSDVSERRVWLSIESKNTRVHFSTFSPVSVKPLFKRNPTLRNHLNSIPEKCWKWSVEIFNFC